MSRILILPFLILALGLSACGSHLTRTPNETSSLVITLGGQSVSAPGSKASINMVVGEKRIYKIMRNVTKAGATTSTDVTATSDFNFTAPLVAAMDASGQLTALTTGFTTLEVIFRDGNGDPTTDDKVSMDITVGP